MFVEWDEPRPDPRATDIYAQRIDAAGRRQWSTGGFCVCAGDGYQFSRTLAHDVGGSVFFVWHHSSPEGRNKLGALGIPLDSPVPALVSLVSVSATPGRVLITWFTSEGPGTRAVVRRRVEGGDWQAVGEVRSDGTGMVAYEDREVAEGGRYGYALRLDSSDGEVAGPETWVDVPRAAGLSIQRIGSNPGASLSVVVSLPDRMPTRLELYDTGGRRLLARELGQLGPGQHTLDVSDAAAIAPGVYQLSLVHGGRRTNLRAVVLR